VTAQVLHMQLLHTFSRKKRSNSGNSSGSRSLSLRSLSTQLLPIRLVCLEALSRRFWGDRNGCGRFSLQLESLSSRSICHQDLRRCRIIASSLILCHYRAVQCQAVWDVRFGLTMHPPRFILHAGSPGMTENIPQSFCRARSSCSLSNLVHAKNRI
jgi:hypothetical protein